MDALSLQVAVAATSQCSDKTGPCAFSDRWADFFANYVAPTRDVTVPALCVFFAILVLARLVPLTMTVRVSRAVSWDEEPRTDHRASEAATGPAEEGQRTTTAPVDGAAPDQMTQGLGTSSGPVGDPAVWPRRRRVAALALGIVLALGSALTVALWLPDIGPRVLRWSAIAATIVAGFAAAVLIGSWLGSRLRLTIDATSEDGSKSPSAAAHVAARVGELGGSAPGGLELARGTDTSALLGSALTDVPEGKLAQLAVRILQGALGTSPWRADVDQFNATTVSVVVTRNGRQAGSAVIDRDLLLAEAGLKPVDTDADRIDLHRFVAAVIVTTLARFHPREFTGLCGASDWRSLGLYYLGSTRYDDPRYYDAQKRAFARAVELDRNNWLAQLGFRRAVDRRSSDPSTLARYRRWLERLTGSGEVLSRQGFRALRLRALYTCLSLAINGMFAPPAEPTDEDPDPPTTSWEDALADAKALFDAIKAEMPEPKTQEPTGQEPNEEKPGKGRARRRRQTYPNAKLAQDLAVTSAPLVLTVLEQMGTAPTPVTDELSRALQPYLRVEESAEAAARPGTSAATPERRPDPAIGLSTKALYNAGCYYGSRPVLEVGRALRCLRRAIEDERFKKWALGDPQLARLRTLPSFWSMLGYSPRKEFLDLATVVPFADRLGRAGLTSAREIARCSIEELVDQTGARTAEAAALHALAALHLDVPAGQEHLGVEVLHELVGRGCASRDALRRLGTARATVAAEVVRALGERLYVSPSDEAALEMWLGDTDARP